jgi:GTP-binding protein
VNPTLTNTNLIRNVAIIAHVDHGKTTLVDGLLKQAGTFRDNQAEMSQEFILDSGDLERERGITISAKTIAVNHNGYKINIIDTPGHADFSGEVERTLNMADGCLLIVDAVEGPMPQTKFVLSRALALGLKPVVVVNKVDKRDARATEVVSEVEHLFLELAITDNQLEFPVYYAIGRDGKAWDHEPTAAEVSAPANLEAIFDAITNDIPAPRVDPSGDFQMLVTSLAWDSYQGKYAIGRVERGDVRAGQALALINRDGAVTPARAEKLFVARGLERVEVSEVAAGDIVWITGVANASIGATLAAPENPEALPVMKIEDPTLQIQIGPNTSPLAGREGKFTTSRQIGARLARELETNVGLRVSDRGTDFLVSGRGELHLSVLIETLRREGFELQVGRPQVVTKEEAGRILEPIEELTIEVPEEHVGAVTSELGRRRANLVTMEPTTKATTRLIFTLPTRTLLGLRGRLLTTTKGTAIVNSLLAGYEPLGPALQQLRNGVLISAATGPATTYSLATVEERGTAFIGPGTQVYEGMIIGLNRRGDDLEINVTKEKKLTNVRASSTDMTTQLTPFTELTLEEALDFIEADELLEVTPSNLRLRKRYLTNLERKRHRSQA